MGEALITRRGGGGSLTKSTDISDSVVWDQNYGEYGGVFCPIDLSKVYFANVIFRYDSDGSRASVAFIVSNGAVICDTGSGYHYGVSTANSCIYAEHDEQDGVNVYDLFVYLLE